MYVNVCISFSPLSSPSLLLHCFTYHRPYYFWITSSPCCRISKNTWQQLIFRVTLPCSAGFWATLDASAGKQSGPVLAITESPRVLSVIYIEEEPSFSPIWKNRWKCTILVTYYSQCWLVWIAGAFSTTVTFPRSKSFIVKLFHLFNRSYYTVLLTISTFHINTPYFFVYK